jgi:hypothetical protein
MEFEYFFLYVALMIILAGTYQWYKKKKYFNYIDSYILHKGLMIKFRSQYPDLSKEQANMVIVALKDYFKMCKEAEFNFVSMPSQVVDDLWHEFILFTRQYQKFCKMAFGQYLHHTPAEAMQNSNSISSGIKRAWKLACKLERIDPKEPSRLPRIFAIDAALNIENGFYYSLDCAKDKSGNYCASGFGCGGSGCGSSCGGSSCGSSCGGGCGGG